MSMDSKTFMGKVFLLLDTFYAYANAGTELAAVSSSLNADATSRDITLQTPAQINLRPGNFRNTPFTNAVLRLVNAGKAGNLSTATMAQLLANLFPPVNTVAPVIMLNTPGSNGDGSGNMYINNVAGTWVPSGGTLTRQWRANGANIPGATTTSYTTVAANLGQTITVANVSTNVAGPSAPAVSNGLVVPA